MQKEIELKDGDGNTLHEGDRVFSYDYVNGKAVRVYGTLLPNDDEFKHVADWYVEYDDGAECAVLEPKLLFKA